MGWISTSPAVGFLGGEGLAVVGFDISPLGSAEPEIVAFEQRIELTEIGFSCIRILQMGATDRFERVGGRWCWISRLKLLEERVEYQE